MGISGPGPGYGPFVPGGDDDQELAESFDESKLSTDPLTLDTSDFPPDEPEGVDDYGTTAQEERVDEPLTERVRREEPDPLAAELDRAVRAEDAERRHAHRAAEHDDA